MTEHELRQATELLREARSREFEARNHLKEVVLRAYNNGEGLSQKLIIRTTGMAAETIRRWLAR